MRWIHNWQDGPLSADDVFSEDIVDTDRILDDEELWAAYERAVELANDLRRRVNAATREPTPEEREMRRLVIRSHLITISDGDTDFLRLVLSGPKE